MTAPVKLRPQKLDHEHLLSMIRLPVAVNSKPLEKILNSKFKTSISNFSPQNATHCSYHEFQLFPGRGLKYARAASVPAPTFSVMVSHVNEP